jgi:NADPH2:quinone reductase
MSSTAAGSKFEAYRIVEENGRSSGRVVELSLADLAPGDVTIAAEYSSVNYKDALAGTGTGKVVRRFPIVGGIDVAGTVQSSGDSRIAVGDRVIVTGYDFGVAHDGGYAGLVRVPGDWVIKLSPELSTFEAMTIGTAGFTAALSIVELERNGLTPSSGPVIVTGATGGVGSMAVSCLAAAGYAVTAMTGKDSERDFLQSLGAREILVRQTLTMGTKPLEKSIWAGAVDAVGGDVLAWLTRTMMYGAAIACSGLTAGVELHTTVMPFILRGVKLLGIDSVACPMPIRSAVWARLAGDLKPAALQTIAREIGLSDLPMAFATLLEGKARGRFVVRLT